MKTVCMILEKILHRFIEWKAQQFIILYCSMEDVILVTGLVSVWCLLSQTPETQLVNGNPCFRHLDNRIVSYSYGVLYDDLCTVLYSYSFILRLLALIRMQMHGIAASKPYDLLMEPDNIGCVCTISKEW